VPRYRYIGGLDLDVVLPSQLIRVATGDEFDATDADAERLDTHDHFELVTKPAKKATPAATPKD
jgi:hypothetical protein